MFSGPKGIQSNFNETNFQIGMYWPCVFSVNPQLYILALRTQNEAYLVLQKEGQSSVLHTTFSVGIRIF